MDGRVDDSASAGRLLTSTGFAISLGGILLGGLLFFSPAAVWAASPYRGGDEVPIGGRVVDRSGEPVAGATVLLEATRRRFSLRKLKNQRGETLKMPVKTGADGGFQVQWQWDDHFNEFQLAVGLEVTRAGQQDYEIFDRQDITAQVVSGEQVVVEIVLEDSGYFHWLKSWAAGEAGEGESKLYRELGRPDRVEAGARSGETSWWYFETGKVYRFRDGDLDRVEYFDPVPDVQSKADDPPQHKP